MRPAIAFERQAACIWTPENDNAELTRTAANEAYLRWTNPVRSLRYKHRWHEAWEEVI